MMSIEALWRVEWIQIVNWTCLAGNSVTDSLHVARAPILPIVVIHEIASVMEVATLGHAVVI